MMPLMQTLLLLSPLSQASVTTLPATIDLTVMTYNVRRSDLYGWDTPETSWYNVEALDGNDASHGSHWLLMARGDATAQSIIDIGADIVGLQEYEHGQTKDGQTDLQLRLEAQSGQAWFYADPDSGSPVLSRYRIAEVSAYGVKVQVTKDQAVWIYNHHYGLGSDWNQSYIPYAAGNGYTEAEIIDFVSSWDNWGSYMDALRDELEPMLATDIPVFVTGDFNEPSHVDWTQAAADAGYIPLAVACPLSLLYTQELGMIDGYHQDRIQDGETEVSRWGYTWTSDGAGSWDDDRIDFVYHSGDGVEVIDALVVGDANTEFFGLDDVNLKAWWDSHYYTVSDHRAVAVRYLLSTSNGPTETGLNETGIIRETATTTTTTDTDIMSETANPDTPSSSAEASGCGCQVAGLQGWSWMLTLWPLLLLRRRDVRD